MAMIIYRNYKHRWAVAKFLVWAFYWRGDKIAIGPFRIVRNIKQEVIDTFWPEKTK